MNDEFTVTHVTEHGSEGGSLEFYNLLFGKKEIEVEELTIEELRRLGKFITDYCQRQEEGGES